MQENMFLQQKTDVSPISNVSAVNSGCSPITHEGKSNNAMLQGINIVKQFRYKTRLLPNHIL